MGQLHTHYDNLKISRNAPMSVIKAAYKALAQENHPDRCSDKDAPRRMQVINEAYAVLSDQAKRAEHDNWIFQNEKVAAPSPAAKHVPAENSKIERLRQLHRADLLQLRQSHAVELSNLNGVARFNKVFYIVIGILIALPVYSLFSDLDSALKKQQYDQAQQYQEANMRRN